MEDWRMARDPSFSQEFCRFPNTSRQHGLPPRYPSPSRESWRNVGHRSGPLESFHLNLRIVMLGF
uniref:Uncharacterized protein n=1 Tax=Heterorhabditis bacteriophora TaxID=37862 RepID=A0A1I7WVR0_HETBA